MTAVLQDATQQLVERFRFVLSEVMDQFEHPRDAVTAAMSAGITFAGVQAGTLIALGDIADDAAGRKRLTDMIEKNFAEGEVLGKRATAKRLMKKGRRQ